MKNLRFLLIIAIVLIIIGIILISFPYVSNYLYIRNVIHDKEEFIDIISNVENENMLDKLYMELLERNKELYEKKQENLRDPFSYEQTAIDLSEYGIENNIIGYISIPKIDIELPILLGANSENLKKATVHLTETSYPIGGENTKCVIAAHRGYSKSKMFRNIDKIEYDDEIYIRNFREELIYKVYDIKLITPDDISELLIEEGKDIITLITCHPYRVNTQRYIVKARRV